MKNKLKQIGEILYGNKFGNILYDAFVILIVVVALWMFSNVPVQSHFEAAANNDVWFGDGWHYVDSAGNIDWESTVEVSGRRYIRGNTDKGTVTIAKRVEEKPSEEDFFCFRTSAHDIKVYVNGACWYTY